MVKYDDIESFNNNQVRSIVFIVIVVSSVLFNCFFFKFKHRKFDLKKKTKEYLQLIFTGELSGEDGYSLFVDQVVIEWMISLEQHYVRFQRWRQVLHYLRWNTNMLLPEVTLTSPPSHHPSPLFTKGSYYSGF